MNWPGSLRLPFGLALVVVLYDTRRRTSSATLDLSIPVAAMIAVWLRPFSWETARSTAYLPRGQPNVADITDKEAIFRDDLRTQQG